MTTRIYTGKVLKLEHIWTSAFGLRTYIVYFKTGHAYYQCHKKRTLQINVEQVIHFSGHWNGDGDAFSIDRLHQYGQKQMDSMWSKEYEKIMAEHILEES